MKCQRRKSCAIDQCRNFIALLRERKKKVRTEKKEHREERSDKKFNKFSIVFPGQRGSNENMATSCTFLLLLQVIHRFVVIVSISVVAHTFTSTF